MLNAYTQGVFIYLSAYSSISNIKSKLVLTKKKKSKLVK